MRLASLLLVILARAGVAQTPGAAVSGVVYDSIARAPLSSAMVQLVTADSQARVGRSAMSDSAGRFVFTDVPDGRYTIGFFHPILDSLGLEPMLRDVRIEGRRSMRVDLAIPSAARLREAMCGPRPATDSGGVVIGVLRNARDGAPVVGGTVTATWVELSLVPTGVVRETPTTSVTTRENGWFAICDVPRIGTIGLTAKRGADSTDLVEVHVPQGGFLRRELFLAAAGLSAQGRLSGSVVAAADGRPLAGAVVAIINGPQTRANDRGEWTLADLPLGTRMLEVRAISYYPERRPVDVVADAAPLRVSLATLKAVLDTVKVAATRPVDRDRLEFEVRRRSGYGRYLTMEDIARRRPFVTSDLFRMMPGVRFERTRDGEDFIVVRGAVADWCTPSLYIDGLYMWQATPNDINAYVNPSDITGIEVYAGIGTPVRFQQGLSGCGAIVIWTNMRDLPRRQLTKRSVLSLLGVVAFSVAASVLLTNR